MGWEKISDTEIEQLQALGYKTGRYADCSVLIAHDGLLVKCFRHDKRLCFIVEYAQSKHGWSVNQTWSGWDEEEFNAQHKPERYIRTSLKNKTLMDAWLNYTVLKFKTIVAKYEAMLERNKKLFEECERMNGKWHASNSKPSDTDFFEVKRGVFTYKKNVAGSESLELDSYNIENKKDFFLNVSSKMAVTPKSELMLEYSVWDIVNGEEKQVIVDYEGSDAYSMRIYGFKFLKAVYEHLNDLAKALDDTQYLVYSVRQSSVVTEGMLKAGRAI